MHGKVVLGIRSAGNVKQSERPTKYAQGGKKGNMLTRPCPCILKKKGKK
jgi:hypothetical protein